MNAVDDDHVSIDEKEVAKVLAMDMEPDVDQVEPFEF